MKKSEKRDFRQELSDKIIDLMERGEAMWQKPWKAGELRVPHNPVSGTRYHGGNAMLLMMVGMELGYTDDRWMTYKQAASLGAQVRKGEKAMTVEYWKWSDTTQETDPITGDEITVETRLKHPRVFYAHVFNAAQIDGLPEAETGLKNKPDWSVNEVAEAILNHSGALIYYDQADKAFYRPSNDTIHLPERHQFVDEAGFYEVALHELAHWTGHESRLNRDILHKFNSKEYAFEELVAQNASLFISADLGIPFNPERHAGYNQMWAEVIREDKNAFFKATREAGRAADFLLAFGPNMHAQVSTKEDMSL